MSLAGYAQPTIFDCGTEEANFPAGFFNFDPPSEQYDNRPYVFGVHFYQLNRDNGTNENSKSELDILKGLAMLNQVFNQFNIFFKWDGYDQIDSTEFYEYDDSNPSWGIAFDNFLTDPHNNHFVTQKINIYLVKSLNDGLIGSASQFWNHDGVNIKIRSDWFHHRALAHEMGHTLGLKHTFGNYESGNDQCETVTRNVNDTLFNAYTKGDRLIQTNATPHRYTYDGVELDMNCNYKSSSFAVDCEGDLYVDPEFKNIMSYTRMDCFKELKPAQGAVMRKKIAHKYLGALNQHLDTIHREELYKPYKGVYYASGPNTSNNPPLFQLGFDYEFVDCGGANQIYNQPSDYNDTSFNYNGALIYYNDDHTIDNIEHVNHTAVRILQVDHVQPRKCYNNYNLAATGGSVTKFMDGTPNGNYETTAQDSTAINDANLIPNLDPGLYNIQKNYNDGSTDQIMIYRTENN